MTTSASLPQETIDHRMGTGFMSHTSTFLRFFHLGRWEAMTSPASVCEEVGHWGKIIATSPDHSLGIQTLLSMQHKMSMMRSSSKDSNSEGHGQGHPHSVERKSKKWLKFTLFIDCVRETICVEYNVPLKRGTFPACWLFVWFTVEIALVEAVAVRGHPLGKCFCSLQCC